MTPVYHDKKTSVLKACALTTTKPKKNRDLRNSCTPPSTNLKARRNKSLHIECTVFLVLKNFTFIKKKKKTNTLMNLLLSCWLRKKQNMIGGPNEPGHNLGDVVLLQEIQKQIQRRSHRMPQRKRKNILKRLQKTTNITTCRKDKPASRRKPHGKPEAARLDSQLEPHKSTFYIHSKMMCFQFSACKENFPGRNS